ncbi:MAG: orotidine-5'-phosphate decarboxylase [Pseudomonadota bacterium]
MVAGVPIFVAIDKPSLADALELAEPLVGIVGGLKLGLQFVHAEGPKGVERLARFGLPIFLDLKLHDIPNTVAGAVRSLAPLGARFLTIHASGGPAMMEAALDAAQTAPGLQLLGVTVLTSLDSQDLRAVGQQDDASNQTKRLAGLAVGCGLTGLVCAPPSIADLRAMVPSDTVLMVPGIRPQGSAVGDQKRVMDPAGALSLGANFLVIGRSITAAPDPAKAASAIVETL